MANSPRTKSTPSPAPAAGGEVADFDALLETTPDTPVEESEEQRKIRELEAELAQPLPEPEEDFIPTEKLSPEQQRIRELEDLIARRNAEIEQRKAASFQQVDAEGRDTILFHVLKDGFTVNGTVFYRGQEVEFVVGSKAYEDTKDRNGSTFLDLVNDVRGQYQRWGAQYVAPGPWPFEQWGSTAGLTDADEIEAAQKAAEAERRRGRAAPVIR